MWLEFGPAYNEISVQHVNHFATGILRDGIRCQSFQNKPKLETVSLVFQRESVNYLKEEYVDSQKGHRERDRQIDAVYELVRNKSPNKT